MPEKPFSRGKRPSGGAKKGLKKTVPVEIKKGRWA